MVIYRATNTINGRQYVGQAEDFDKRFTAHTRSYDGTYFHNAITKYGIDVFEWEIICECSSSKDMNEKEIYYISHFNTLAPNGYNLTKGGTDWKGDMNPAKLPHVRQKISEKAKGRKRDDLADKNRQNTGKTYEELYGKEKAAQMKEKLSKKCAGESNPNYGNKRTSESKDAQRQKMVKYEYHLTSPEGKEYIYTSMRLMCEELNLNRSSIMRVLKNGKQYKGWTVTRELL
jgi:group I intron endonuclease